GSIVPITCSTCGIILKGVDHTNPGTGNLFSASFASPANSTPSNDLIFSKSISVSSNQNYAFNFWYMNPISGTAFGGLELHTLINGSDLRTDVVNYNSS